MIDGGLNLQSQSSIAFQPTLRVWNKLWELNPAWLTLPTFSMGNTQNQIENLSLAAPAIEDLYYRSLVMQSQMH